MVLTWLLSMLQHTITLQFYYYTLESGIWLDITLCHGYIYQLVILLLTVESGA